MHKAPHQRKMYVPSILTGGRGQRALCPDRLRGHWGLYKRGGHVFHSVRLGTRGRKGGSSSPGPLQSQDRFMLLLGQTCGRYFNAISKYQQEASRERHQQSIHYCFCRKLEDKKSTVKTLHYKSYLPSTTLNAAICFSFVFLLEGVL